MSSKRKPFDELALSSQKHAALTNGLNARHRQLLRELVGGATPTQAGVRCGYHIGRVRQLMQSPVFMGELEKMEANIDAKFEDEMVDDTTSVSSILKNAAPAAARGMVEQSEKSVDEKVKLAARKEILDRTGHKAPEESIVNIDVNTTEAIEDVLDLLLKREGGKESKEDAPSE